MNHDTKKKIEDYITKNRVMLFMKGTKQFPQCGFSARAVEALKRSGAEFETANVLADPELREGIKEFSNWPTIPQVYIDGKFVGGSDIVLEMFQSGELAKLVKSLALPRPSPRASSGEDHPREGPRTARTTLAPPSCDAGLRRPGVFAGRGKLWITHSTTKLAPVLSAGLPHSTFFRTLSMQPGSFLSLSSSSWGLADLSLPLASITTANDSLPFLPPALKISPKQASTALLDFSTKPTTSVFENPLGSLTPIE